jgi:PAS domain S-box-containing protein
MGISSKALKDLGVLAVGGASLFGIALWFDVPHALREWSLRYKISKMGEFCVIAVIVAGASALFFLRRRWELRAQVRDLRKTESKLGGSEDLYRQFLETACEGVWVVDAEAHTIFINRRGGELLGYAPEEMRGMPFLAFVDPEWQSVARDRLESAQFAVNGQHEFKFRRKDGGDLYALLNTSPLADREGRFTGAIAMLTDITDRRQIADALRQSEEKFRSIFDNAGVGIAMIDTEGTHLENNPALCRMTGFSEEELTGKGIPYRYWPDQLVGTLSETVKRVSAEGRIETETRFRRKTGGEFPVSIVASSVFDHSGRQVASLWIIQDISERSKVDEELLKEEKLESVGVLAGGIAHDFNNILTGVMGYISLAKMCSRPDDRSFEFLEKAEKASLKAKALTQQLLTFSKGGAPVKKTAVITDIIRDTAIFASRGSKVRCEFSLPADLWLADIDVGQISQVIQNLIINAEQAMPGGGTIHIKAENIGNIAAEVLYGLPLDSRRYIKISIQDRGVGIPTECLTKIFDPYFTTKQKGSGLGLATTHSIVKRHEGHISVESKYGEGATFHLYLPASEKQEAYDFHEGEKRAPWGEGRVLVMDDEDIVREVAGKMLKALGYEPAFAADGAEAIEKYEKAQLSGGAFDAVIMDLTIPGGMGGEEAIGRLLAIDPHLKAIASSGYSTDPIMSDSKAYGFRGFIAKPYVIEELGKVLHDVLTQGI